MIMDSSEIKGLVWETLALSKKPFTPEAIADENGLNVAQVVRGLSALRQVRLVENIDPLPKPTYIATLRLDAMRWALALEEGIPLSVLEKHASLAVAERQEALRLASTGAVDRAREQSREEKKRHREEILRGRAATRAAATDVARIAEDARKTLEDAKSKSRALNPHVLAILQRAHEQAMKAVDQISRSLA